MFYITQSRIRFHDAPAPKPFPAVDRQLLLDELSSVKDMTNERQSSDLLLLRRESVLLASVRCVIPGTFLEVADVVFRNEEFVLHLTELVSVVDNKLSHVFDAGGDIDALLSLCVNSVGLSDGLAINAVCIEGHDVTCQFSEKLFHDQ